MADNKPEGYAIEYPALIACNRPISNTGSDLNTPPPDLRDHRVAPSSHRIVPSVIIRNGASQTVIEALKNVKAVVLAKALAEWVRQNTRTVVIVSVLVPLMCVGLVLSVLRAIGFGSGGIVLGSIAAVKQAGIGSVAAGGFFATLTSAAMGGYGLPLVIGTVWVVTSGVGWGLVAWRWWVKRRSGGGGGGGDDNDDKDGFQRALVRKGGEGSRRRG